MTIRAFGSASDTISLGMTPLTQVRVPRGAFHWRVERSGYVPADLVTATPAGSLRFDLRADSAPDRDMIRIPAGEVRLWVLGGVSPVPSVTLGAYLIDRHEVTNRQFARFVAAGGYAREEFWKHPFRDGAGTLSFQEAMARFKDSTGRPGPATWKLGSHPDGDEELPVGGVSWYEAAAYAVFAGKELPTIYHCFRGNTPACTDRRSSLRGHPMRSSFRRSRPLNSPSWADSRRGARRHPRADTQADTMQNERPTHTNSSPTNPEWFNCVILNRWKRPLRYNSWAAGLRVWSSE